MIHLCVDAGESVASSETPLVPFFDIKAEIPPELIDCTAQAAENDGDDEDKNSHNSSCSRGMGRSRPLVRHSHQSW